MEDKKSTILTSEKKKTAHPAVGMWKNKWSKKKSSVEAAREMRKKQWQRS